MTGVSEILRSKTGRSAAVATLLIGVAAVAWSIHSNVRSETPDTAYYSTYICTETGKPFRHRNQIGELVPIQSPYSGKSTGLPAQPCFWTASGGTKAEATWVLLNEQVGKSGPTFCPDCGRLVVGHNPEPKPGVKPPPTSAEYAGRGQANSRDDRSAAEAR